MKPSSSLRFNLGDSKFNQKLSSYYRWTIPLIFIIFGLVLFLNKAYTPGFLCFVIGVIWLPFLRVIYQTLGKWPLRILTAALVILLLVSMSQMS